MTVPEKLLWRRVRRNGLDGFHFRRQQIIAGFVVDCYCHEARLAVERDGSVHDGNQSYDKARDQAIAAYDVEVLRIPNDLVTQSLDAVLVQILQLCQARSEVPAKAPQSGCPFPIGKGDRGLGQFPNPPSNGFPPPPIADSSIIR